MQRTNKRKEAQALGLVHYSTGRPCKRGHVALRKTADGNCVVCAPERARIRNARPEVRLRTNALAKVYRARPEVAASISERNKRQRRADPRLHMFFLAKRRAKRKEVAFDITVEDIVVPSVCPALGIPLRVSEGHSSPNSPTLDRIIPALGYVPGNVAVISALANSIKQNAEPAQLVAVAKWVDSMWPEHLRW